MSAPRPKLDIDRTRDRLIQLGCLHAADQLDSLLSEAVRKPVAAHDFLEALLEARTQTIVGLGARLAELQGDAPPPLTERVRQLEAELAQLRATKVLRYSALPRRWYAALRGRRG